MKSLQQHIEEKLIINKDSLNSVFTTNEEYLEHFKDKFRELTAGNRWLSAKSIEEIYSIKLTNKYIKEISEIFEEKIKGNTIFYFLVTNHYGLRTYNEMMEYMLDHSDDYEYLKQGCFGGGIYYVRIFETKKVVFALIGPPHVYDCMIDDNLLNAQIIYAYKK